MPSRYAPRTPRAAPSEVPGAGDAPALWALDRACFPDPWSEDGWREELTGRDRAWRLVRAGGRPVAAAGLLLAPGAAHVLRLAVAPPWRGRGVASRLVADLIEVAARSGQPALTLEVRASNRAARSLYRRLGFVSHGRRPGYYPDGEDAVILWRTSPGGAGHDTYGR
jgi:[ribosomal protein S18]-alanine N-acetyltransferase